MFKFKYVSGVLLAATVSVAGTPPKESPALLEKGKSVFATNCVTCHGEKGDGNGPAGAYMNPKPRNFATEKFKKGDKPQQIFNSITNGLEGTAMTSYKHIPEDERWALAYYVHSFRSKKAK